MISAKGLLSVVLLVSYVEGSSIQRASIQFTNTNRRQNIQTQNNQPITNIGRGFTSHQNVGSNDNKLSTTSSANLSDKQQTPDSKIVTGRPVNGGAKTPSFEEFIIRQPLKTEERAPESGDDFIRNVLEVAAKKVNDDDFLHAIQSIEDHLERTVGGTRKTSSTPKTITSTSPTNTPRRPASVSPQNIVRKFVINSKNEISEVKGNSPNSLNPKNFDSNNNRSPLNSFSRNNNEGRKKIVLVPRNMSMDVLKMHLPQFSSQNLKLAKLPQFSSQNLRVSKLVSTTKTGDKATGNLIVLPSGTIVTEFNNRPTKKPFTHIGEKPKELQNNQSTVNEQINQEIKLLEQQLDIVNKQINSNNAQTDTIKGSHLPQPSNVVSPNNSLTSGNNIDRVQSNFNEPFDNPFSFQSENFPSSMFPSEEDSIFTTFSKSTGELEKLNPPLTIQSKEQSHFENQFTQSGLQKDSFTPSFYIGPIQISQFIKSVQPTITGDLDIVKASQVNKAQRKTDSVRSNNERLSGGIVFDKPNFFETESHAIFHTPFVFNQDSLRRPKSQPLRQERLTDKDNSRFKDDLQLSHIQPNLNLFPEASRFRSIPHQKKTSSPNGFFSSRSAIDSVDLSWFGTRHPGIDLTAFDPQIRLAN